jgi:hypothetical protein
MHSLEPELNELHAARLIDDDAAARAIAIERGTLFTVFQELRLALYLAVAMITTGVGLWLKDHLDRIGALTIVVALAVAAACCYAWPLRNRLRGIERSLGGDYVLLLGALLLSVDLGFAETQFQWLGERWSWHLLLLAGLHAVAAYWFDSRLLLSVALSSLAAWFGLETSLGPLSDLSRLPVETGGRALTCAAVIYIARGLNHRDGRRPQFQPVFEHFAINLAFIGALAWSFSTQRAWIGLAVTVGLATLMIMRGLRLRQEIFAVYGVGYTAIAAGAVLARQLSDRLAIAALTLLIVLAAAVTLWQLHMRLRPAAP